MTNCARCKSVGRDARVKGKHLVIGPNGIKSYVCNQCWNELKNKQ